MDHPHSWALQALLLSALFLYSCEENSPRAVTQKTADTTEATPTPPPAEPAAKTGPPAWSNRTTSMSGFSCDVEEVLALTCRRCHWNPQENDAPFPLATWEDTQKERSGKPIHILMAQMIEADLMPPTDLVLKPPVTRLTDDQKNVLLRVLKEGAKKSEETCD
jgi:hypothetical protein